MLHAPRPQAKSYDAAIADCSACLELDPSYFKAYRTRARAHLALEDYDSSLRDFKQAYELAPSGSSDEAALKREVREAEATLKKSKMIIKCWGSRRARPRSKSKRRIGKCRSCTTRTRAETRPSSKR
jgi:tetratricopeptide (TPR) repeat protein